jgi:MFS superfamily sulfate permease-like transporter
LIIIITYFKKLRELNSLLKELYALGSANMFASFFGCFPSAGSLSRSSILESIGAKSQVFQQFHSLINI